MSKRKRYSSEFKREAILLTQHPDASKGHNLVCSMSAVGSCADNAAVEGFFGILKRKRVNRRRYLTRAEARSDIFDYIERFYNPLQRRKMERQESMGMCLTKLSVESG